MYITKKTISIFFTSLFLFINVPAFCNSIPQIQSWTTDNGIRVLFSETHQVPILNIQVIFNAGSACDDNLPGIAAFTNAMLGEGTKDMSYDEIAESFDKIGARYTANTDLDTATVSLNTLVEPKILDSALQTFITVLSEPSFSQQAFSRLKGQILTALDEEQQQPDIVMRQQFFKKLYNNQHYGNTILGTKEKIQAIAPYNLQFFYNKYYVAQNALLVIVGDITPAQAKNIANRISSKIRNREKTPKQKSAETTLTDQNQSDKSNISTQREEHIDFPSEQTYIAIGQIGIAINDVDFFPLLLGNYILGKSPLSSELFKEVRDKRGLAYNVSSDFIPLKTPGPFIIILQTSNKNSAQAISVVYNVLQKFLQEGPTEQQLVFAKQGLTGQFPLKISNNYGIANALGIIGFYNLPLDYLDTYRAKINAVTLTEIKDAFKKHLNFNNMITVTVGKKINL